MKKPVSAMSATERRARVEAIWAEMQYRRYGDGFEGFVAFCNELYWVRSKSDPRGRAKFKLYPFQRELAEAYFNGKFHVVLKSRQLGATTLAMAYAIWLCIYRPGGCQILNVNKTQIDARSNLEQVNFALSFFPQWFRERMPDILASSNDKLTFGHPDGATSAIECLVATERSGASRTADLVIADEAALYTAPEGTFRSLAPVTDAAAAKATNEAVMLVFSTARGGSNYFAQLWKDAQAGRNQYKAHFIPWMKNPLSNPLALEGGVDTSIVDARRQEFIHQPHLFAAEYPSTPEEAWMSTGHSRFTQLPSSILFDDFPFRGALVATGTSSTWVDDVAGPLWLNFDPRNPEDHPNHKGGIVIGADPALGVGSDYSCAYVVQYFGDGLMEIVGYYRNNEAEPLEFADDLYALGWYFGSVSRPALIACEINPSGGGGGATVIGRLRDRGYQSLYRYVQPAARGRKALSYYGVPATRSVKPLFINAMADWLTPDPMLGDEGTPEALPLRSIPPILRDELGTYIVQPNGATNADSGCMDDNVIACAIAVYAAGQTVKAPTPTRSVQGEEQPSADVLRLDLSEVRKQIERDNAKARKQQRQVVRRQQRITRGRRR